MDGLGAGPSVRARRPRGGGLVVRRVEPQTRDRRDAATAHGVEEQQSREAAVTHHHKVAPRQPAPSLERELTSDVDKRLVPTAPFTTGAHGRHQGGQEWQRSDAPRPGGPARAASGSSSAARLP